MSALKDLTGQRFGRLVVVGRADKITLNREAVWNCQCDCGATVIVRGASLRKGDTKSCGCMRDEIESRIHSTHRKTKTRLYNVWTHIIQRCYNQKHTAYKNYGGRGITVCDEWRNDFMKFHDWAMENGYDETAPQGKCTIDRIDNDKGYSPDNCRWTDMKVQRHNQRKQKETKNERH